MSEGFRLGVFYTIIRPEEKAILAAAEHGGYRPRGSTTAR